MRSSVFAVSCLVMAMTGGCSLMPEYFQPELPVEDRYAGPTEDEPVYLLGWRDFFIDPDMQELIALALENNRDLRQAALNVEAYRAQYRIERAALYPTINANASANRRRIPPTASSSGGSQSQSSSGGSSGDTSGAPQGQNQAYISAWYSSTLSMSWELDFFGRLDSLREQAQEAFLATEAARRSTQVTLVASVANAWMTLQSDRALLQLTEDTLAAYEDTLSLSRLSFEVGTASELDVRQAQTSVESARVTLQQYKRAVQQDRNALVLLLGQGLPEHIDSDWDPGREQLVHFPVGMPSSLLLQRPDILEAEYQLRAANANIGAARAAFFPTVSLTTSAGTASGDMAGLFDAGSGYWSFMPVLSVPIFTAGDLDASLDYSRISKNMQVAAYEKAIQTAFSEVNDGLAARTTYVDQVRAQQDLVYTSQEYYRLADLRYRTGIDDYLTLLDAQRQLFSAQQQLISDQLEQRIAEVNLYKALGGGWKQRTADAETALVTADPEADSAEE